MIETRWLESTPDKAALLGGIVDDVQRLLKQEVALAGREIRDEVTKAKVTAASMAGAACLAGFAAVFFLLGAIHWLQWLTELPLWACYLIAAGILGVATAVLFLQAKNKAKQIEMIPQTVETMKENIQWMQDQV